jgi:hypothetical protein
MNSELESVIRRILRRSDARPGRIVVAIIQKTGRALREGGLMKIARGLLTDVALYEIAVDEDCRINNAYVDVTDLRSNDPFRISFRVRVKARRENAVGVAEALHDIELTPSQVFFREVQNYLNALLEHSARQDLRSVEERIESNSFAWQAEIARMVADRFHLDIELVFDTSRSVDSRATAILKSISNIGDIEVEVKVEPHHSQGSSDEVRIKLVYIIGGVVPDQLSNFLNLEDAPFPTEHLRKDLLNWSLEALRGRSALELYRLNQQLPASSILRREVETYVARLAGSHYGVAVSLKSIHRDNAEMDTMERAFSPGSQERQAQLESFRRAIEELAIESDDESRRKYLRSRRESLWRSIQEANSSGEDSQRLEKELEAVGREAQAANKHSIRNRLLPLVSGKSTGEAPVDFSIIAPNQIPAGSNFIVEVWVTPSGERARMLEQATRPGRMIERGGRSQVNLERGSITIILKLPDFEVAEPMEILGWNGDIQNVGFVVKAPTTLAPGIYSGFAKLMRGRIPFVSITFDLEVASAEAGVDQAPKSLSARVQRIAHAFASYASQDRSEVLRRVQGIQAAGTKVFLDIVSLRNGDDWEKTLYREIDASDGFFLFWSRSAAKSSMVEREWRYALEQRGIDFISPVPLEDPRLVDPPAELRSKHFNDMLLSFIKAEDSHSARL